MQSQQSEKSFIPKCSCNYDEVSACMKGKNLTGDLQSMAESYSPRLLPNVNGVKDCFEAKCGRDDISRMENACFAEIYKNPEMKHMEVLRRDAALLDCMRDKLKKDKLIKNAHLWQLVTDYIHIFFLFMIINIQYQ